MTEAVNLLASKCLSASLRSFAWKRAVTFANQLWLPNDWKWNSHTDSLAPFNGSAFKINTVTQYHPIQFKRIDYESQLLQVTKRPFNNLNVLTRTFVFRRKNEKPKKNSKRIPKLVLIQSPFTWIMNKIDFSVLKHIWDPTFQENEFKYGTKQAISRVTKVISDGQYSELNGLLTRAAKESLMRELDRNWSERQRTLISLDHDDIQISSPRKVYFIRIADKKFCDVDMAFLALKWAPINNIEALVFAEIFARFHREYTPNCIPEWTIAYFKVTRFEVLRR